MKAIIILALLLTSCSTVHVKVEEKVVPCVDNTCQSDPNETIGMFVFIDFASVVQW